MPPLPSLPYHLAQLADFCRAHPFEAKVVFVPTRQTGKLISDHLAAAGFAWVNLHTLTIAEYADVIAGPSLMAEGRTKLGTDAAQVLIQEFIMQDPDLPEAPLQALGTATFATISTLRAAGVPGEKPAGSQNRLTRFVGRILRRYEAFLTENRRYDAADLLVAATSLSASPACYAIFEETEYTGLQKRFVESVSKGNLVKIGRGAYEIEVPETLAAYVKPPEPTNNASVAPIDACSSTEVARASADGIGRGGFLWDDSVPGDAPGSLSTFVTFSAEGEVREILRQLQAQGIRFDDAELVYTSEEPYLTLAWTLSQTLGIPTTFSGGIPVLKTRPGQALRLYLGWIARGYDAALLVRMLASRLVRLRGVSTGDAIGLLRRAKIGRGRTRYAAALDRIATFDSATAQDDEPRWTKHDVVVADRLRGELDRLIGLVPEGHRIELSALATACMGFLDGFVLTDKKTLDADQKAIETLNRRLQDAVSGAASAWPLEEAVRHFDRSLERHRIDSQAPEPGHLHVSPLTAGGYSGRRYVFVVGLDQSVFPGGSAGNPLLLDEHRKECGLPLMRSKAGDKNWHLVRLLGMNAGDVRLFTAQNETSGEKRLFPSAAFIRAGTISRTDGASALPETIPAMVPVVVQPAETQARAEEEFGRSTLDDTEALLALRAAPGINGLLLGRHTGIAAGIVAAEARASTQWTAFDGFIGPGRPLLKADQRFSASRIEMLLSCRFKYFLHYVLGLAVPEEMQDEEDDRWLDASAFGTLLHRVLRLFVERHRGETLSRSAHEAAMLALVADVVEAEQARAAYPNESAFRRDVERLSRAALVFLAAEETGAPGYPEYLEFAFGKELPVNIPVGNGRKILLQGRIDRIDVMPDDTLEVWDYKSGSSAPYPEEDPFSKHRFQWALYAVAARQVLSKEVSRSGYYFISEREHGRKVAPSLAGLAALETQLAPAFNDVEAGFFPQAAKSNGCSYCDFKRICGDLTIRKKQLIAKPPRPL